jgi:hypothetical protein
MKAGAEKEREERVKVAQEELQRKHEQGVQTNEEMDQELAGVIQAARGGDGRATLEDAKAARKRTIEDRKRRLREQQAEFAKKLREDYDRAERDLQGLDLALEEEAEKRRVEALKQNGLFDEREKEKEAAKLKDRTHRVEMEADQAAESNALLDQLHQQGVDADALLQLEREQQAAKLAARRELLKERRRHRKRQELEEARVVEKIKQMEQQDEAEAAAGEEYVRAVFQEAAEEPAEAGDARPGSRGSQADGKASRKKQMKERRAQLLNECLADTEFERFGNLLAKQFIEKEQYLKLLLQKYAD